MFDRGSQFGVPYVVLRGVSADQTKIIASNRESANTRIRPFAYSNGTGFAYNWSSGADGLCKLPAQVRRHGC